MTNDTLLKRAGLDVLKLGKQLHAGKQHEVYVYDNDKVVKFPRHTIAMWLYGQFGVDDVRHDLEMIEKYFPACMPETQVISVDESYVIVQEYFKQAQPLSPELMRQHSDAFSEILNANERMIQEHQVSLDFFGMSGFLASVKMMLTGRSADVGMQNILYNPEDEEMPFVIVDTNLSYLGLVDHPLQWRHVAFDRVAVKLSMWLVRRYFI